MNDTDYPAFGPDGYDPWWDDVTGDRYDRAGNPISIRDSMRLRAIDKYAVVQQDHVGDYFVSTVWLGFDHNLIRCGEPLIFETMVFQKNGDNVDYLDLTYERYTNEDLALEGHRRMVEMMSLFVAAKP